MSDFLNIVVRVMPGGEQLDVELPRFTTGLEILEGLLSENVAPRQTQQGEPLFYELISKTGNVRIEDHKTLHDLGIQSGETILLVPDLVAGASART
ncbi:EsaB/YukD family protein [Lewinella sp. IMCC34183]|uniref:EsaB/YukD family protein n=1 Tax=Lewinella sp. IMCC34183 TaxID=2248762 RepID=UPI0013008777|nr:EsaB/YukD family protein [Lewinella sp. IMCC34183]